MQKKVFKHAGNKLIDATIWNVRKAREQAPCRISYGQSLTLKRKIKSVSHNARMGSMETAQSAGQLVLQTLLNAVHYVSLQVNNAMISQLLTSIKSNKMQKTLPQAKL